MTDSLASLRSERFEAWTYHEARARYIELDASRADDDDDNGGGTPPQAA